MNITQLIKPNCLAAILATLSMQLVTAPVSSAVNLFPVTVNAFGVSTNQDGNLTYSKFNNWTIIHATAASQGITNLTGISLVYNLQADDIEVVSGTNNTVLGTPLSFDGGISLNNTNETKIQRLANVYWQTNQTASGTLLVGESIRYGSTNQVIRLSFVGQLQFAASGSETNGPTIYYGLVQTSRSGECLPSWQNKQESRHHDSNRDDNDND